MEIKKYTIVTSEKIEMYTWIAMSVQADCLTFVTEERTKKRFASSGNRTRAARVAGEHSTTEPTMLVFFDAMQQYSSCGRVVKATDSKSVSLWERRFESYQLRHGFLDHVNESLFSNFGLLSSVTGHRFLDSLVVRISACHVEGPGSIPGRGVLFLLTTINSISKNLMTLLQ